MEKLNLDKNNLRKFGIVMGIAFLVITLLILIRHRHSIAPAFIISAMFFISALFAPLLLKPIYIFWVNTRFILLVIFYLVFTPIGLAMRLFGVDLLERRMERNRKSYWRQKEKHKFDRLNYERQF